MPFLPPGDLPDPGTEPKSVTSPALAGGFFTAEPPGKSPLERVAIPFSRGSSQLKDQSLISCLAGRFFTTEPPGKPKYKYVLLFKLISSYFIDFYEIDFQV